MMQNFKNKGISNWEAEVKLRSQLHMAVRLCSNTANLEEALRVLKSEHVEKKMARKKTLAQESASE